MTHLAHLQKIVLDEYGMAQWTASAAVVQLIREGALPSLKFGLAGAWLDGQSKFAKIDQIRPDLPIGERFALLVDILDRVIKAESRSPSSATYTGQCIHQGEKIGEVAGCSTCGGAKTASAVFSCAKHEECTTDRQLAGTKCCLNCADYTVEPD